MAFLRVLDEWLEGSGSKSMLSTADVTTEGRADSLHRGTDTARAQFPHQGTGGVLFVLQTEAYYTYRETKEAEDILDFSQWCDEMADKHPQFFYWNKTLQLKILLLQFLRSQRNPNFPLYVETLSQSIPWMFALDHYHYSRWLPVQVKDLMYLPETLPRHIQCIFGRTVCDANFLHLHTTRFTSSQMLWGCHRNHRA